MQFKQCPFCEIVLGRANGKTTKILYRDDKVMAFEDIKPAANKHVLVIPLNHISTVKDLEMGESHFLLVKHMQLVGKEVLGVESSENNDKVAKFGFHIPPFNSIDHLHLHCILLPFLPWWKVLKYQETPFVKYYISAQKVLEKLKPNFQ